jgi:hypothetical protein
MYRLNDKTIKHIEKSFNLSIDDIENMDTDELTKVIEKRIKRKLKFARITDYRLLGRCSILLFSNRFVNTRKMKMKLKKI